MVDLIPDEPVNIDTVSSQPVEPVLHVHVQEGAPVVRPMVGDCVSVNGHGCLVISVPAPTVTEVPNDEHDVPPTYIETWADPLVVKVIMCADGEELYAVCTDGWDQYEAVPAP